MLCCCGILQHCGKKLFDNYVNQIEPTQLDDVDTSVYILC